MALLKSQYRFASDTLQMDTIILHKLEPFEVKSAHTDCIDQSGLPQSIRMCFESHWMAAIVCTQLGPYVVAAVFLR
jgi:hypothetical protein